MAYAILKSELEALADEALKANALAMHELVKQRAALQEVKANVGFSHNDLIPYAPRIQQALTFGAIVYTMAVNETPSLTS